MTGAQLIAKERERQVKSEGRSSDHDAQHSRGELALAAISYAAPKRVFVRDDFARGMSFMDPFPWDGDKRFDYGERRENRGNVPPNPETYTPRERLDLLVKAGALIAAEIDRLQRARTVAVGGGGGGGRGEGR